MPPMRTHIIQTLAELRQEKRIFIGDEMLKIDEDTWVSPTQGSMLHHFASQPNVKRCLEIGFAYGFSTMYILEALRDKSDASHVAIDPHEDTYWKSVGLKLVKHLGYNNFRWVKNYSIHELSRLIQHGSKFDLIYIDGNHRFDDILVDFYLSDQVLSVGGYLILDDMWMRSTRLVKQFIASNRAYKEIPQNSANAVVFEKIADDSRQWNHFEEFDALWRYLLFKTRRLLSKPRYWLTNILR